MVLRERRDAALALMAGARKYLDWQVRGAGGGGVLRERRDAALALMVAARKYLEWQVRSARGGS